MKPFSYPFGNFFLTQQKIELHILSKCVSKFEHVSYWRKGGRGYSNPVTGPKPNYMV